MNIEKPETARPEQEDKTELRFAEIYKSPEWHSLDPIDRAQLLLVAEGVKPGTVIGGDFTNFAKITKKMGLETYLNSDPRRLNPVYEVATPEKMKEYQKEWLTLPEKASPWQTHRLIGKFLGYPECCTEEYIRAGKEVSAKEKQGIKEKYIPKVDKEAAEMIEKTGSYPPELDYCPPSFTPCSANCPEALETLRKWGRILEVADPEAAQKLKEYNQYGRPYRQARQEELLKKEKEELIEYKLEEIRKSIKKY